jgi:hypothetical protein
MIVRLCVQRPSLLRSLGDTLTTSVPMLAFERRWVRDILSSFAPEGGPGLAPRVGEVDYERAFMSLHGSARLIARVGMRIALWLIALAPLWLRGERRTLPALPSEARQALLARLLEHRVYAVREAAFLMKLCACLALFANDAVRARSGYDGSHENLIPLARGRR